MIPFQSQLLARYEGIQKDQWNRSHQHVHQLAYLLRTQHLISHSILFLDHLQLVEALVFQILLVVVHHVKHRPWLYPIYIQDP